LRGGVLQGGDRLATVRHAAASAREAPSRSETYWAGAQTAAKMVLG